MNITMYQDELKDTFIVHVRCGIRISLKEGQKGGIKELGGMEGG